MNNVLINPSVKLYAVKNNFNHALKDINTDRLSKNTEYNCNKGINGDHFHQTSFNGNIINPQPTTINMEEIDSIADSFIDELKDQEDISIDTIKKAKAQTFKNMKLPDIELEFKDMKEFPAPERILPGMVAISSHHPVTNEQIIYIDFEADKADIVKFSAHEFTHFLQRNTKEMIDNCSAILSSKHDLLFYILSQRYLYFENTSMHYTQGMFPPILEGENPNDVYNYLFEKEMKAYDIVSPDERLISIRYFQNRVQNEIQAYKVQIRALNKMSQPVGVEDESILSSYKIFNEFFDKKLTKEKDRTPEGFPEENESFLRIKKKIDTYLSKK